LIDCIGNAPSAKPINGAIDGAPNAAREYPSGQAIIIRKLHHQRSELVLDDQGRSEAAVQCLRKALVVAPDYLDAIFNLALMLQRKGAYAEAARYPWRQYRFPRDMRSDLGGCFNSAACFGRSGAGAALCSDGRSRSPMWIISIRSQFEQRRRSGSRLALMTSRC